ncbi:unnamed protein product [Dovyalis caffra]|uniref:Uncharacterized protein n=1 Tax=Dovyalis caffra TaxID=77055 RepID=A0AAV1QRX9_9ROSI|nr:unnamed protein product [Dovyalis caffra]
MTRSRIFVTKRSRDDVAKLVRQQSYKNCIFLLCNGLLVFVAKYSGLITSSSKNIPTSTIDQSFNNYEDVTSDSKILVLQDELVLVENVDGAQENIAVMEEDTENECMNNIGQTEDREIEELIVEEEEEQEEQEQDDDDDDDDDDDEGDRESGFLITGKEGEGESELSVQGQQVIEYLSEDVEEYDDIGEGNGVLSTEELNKKFEDFIRKMKEEIRIEAQQHLVMVN